MAVTITITQYPDRDKYIGEIYGEEKQVSVEKPKHLGSGYIKIDGRWYKVNEITDALQLVENNE